jgi:hypothetical protein
LGGDEGRKFWANARAKWFAEVWEGKPPMPNKPPSLPEQFFVSGMGAGFVSLSWLPATDPEEREVAYEIQRRSAEGGHPIQWGVKGTAFIDNTVSAGARYEYTIEAIDEEGLRSGVSEPIEAMPPVIDGEAEPQPDPQVIAGYEHMESEARRLRDEYLASFEE